MTGVLVEQIAAVDLAVDFADVLLQLNYPSLSLNGSFTSSLFANLPFPQPHRNVSVECSRHCEVEIIIGSRDLGK